MKDDELEFIKQIVKASVLEGLNEHSKQCLSRAEFEPWKYAIIILVGLAFGFTTIEAGGIKLEKRSVQNAVNIAGAVK
jgi:hypothetical protein